MGHAAKYLINRYAEAGQARIERIEPVAEDEHHITRPDGTRSMKLGDCFDTFEEAKGEWERRCYRALSDAQDALSDAEEAYDVARKLEEV